MVEIAKEDVYTYLKEGCILMVVEDGTLFRWKEGKVGLYAPNWHSEVDEKDFLDLYQHRHFALYEAKNVEIDEKKDDAYYQWASRYQ